MVAISILALAMVCQRFVWNRAVEKFVDSSAARLDRTAFTLEARMRLRANDLFQIKYNLERAARETPDRNPVDTLRPIAIALMIARGGYDQVRYLDPAGKELCRFRWEGEIDDPNPRIEEFPAKELQDKSHRPYFRDTLAAPGDAAVFSALDLNVEHGKIETPFRPVIRITTQIRDAAGKTRGVLVLNCDGRNVLRELSDAKRSGESLFLLNDAGYWLSGPDPAAEWGFQLPGLADRTLAKESPDLWRRFNAAESGWFVLEGTLHSFRKVDPTRTPNAYPALRIATVGGERLRWLLDERIPLADIRSNVAPTVEVIGLVAGIGFLTLGPGAWLLVSALQRRKIVQREIAHSREELSQVLATSPHGILALGSERNAEGRIEDFRIVFGNRAITAPLNQPIHEMIGKKFRRDFPGSITEETFQRFCEVVETGSPAAFEDHFQNDGIERWLRTQAAKLDDGLVISFVDLTDRKLAEERLRRNEALLQMTARISHVGGWEYEIATRRVTWSEEVYRIHEVDPGYQPSVETGIGFYEKKSRSLVAAALGDCAANGTPFDIEAELITAKGRRIWVHSIGEAEWRDGQVVTINGTFQDITEERDAAFALLNAKEEAEAASRTKSDFLAMMSHEIRTPMNAVLGFAGELAETKLDAQQREHLEIITSSGSALLRIIDDILDFSRIESGNFTIEESIFSPRELVDGVQFLLRPRARESGITLETKFSGDLPASVAGDAGRLRQVLVNLAGNAIKFTSEGGVTLGLRGESSLDNSEVIWLRFFVRDTGPGLSPDDVARVFEPFTQADSSIARRYGGTGLGLSISRVLVELMGGELGLTSDPGQGSTFEFTLPLRPTSPEAAVINASGPIAPTADFARHHPLRVLVADDDPINLKLTRRMLERLGYAPITAVDGFSAVEAFRAENPDCVLMDMQMPGMSGLEAARRIRDFEQRTGAANPTFISALTANVLPAERAACRSAGMNDFLPKPLKIDALAALLALAHIERAGPAATSPPKETR